MAGPYRRTRRLRAPRDRINMVCRIEGITGNPEPGGLDGLPQVSGRERLEGQLIAAMRQLARRGLAQEDKPGLATAVEPFGNCPAATAGPARAAPSLHARRQAESGPRTVPQRPV